MSDAPHLQAERLDVLKMLYPWYKEEVYRRRENMMRLTAFGGSFLLLLLAVLSIQSDQWSPNVAALLFLASGASLFFGLFAYLILQQRSRHQMAKQALIRIEQALGLYEEGRYVPGESLYPEDWQAAWKNDRTVRVYLLLLATLTVLVLAAALVHF